MNTKLVSLVIAGLFLMIAPVVGADPFPQPTTTMPRDSTFSATTPQNDRLTTSSTFAKNDQDITQQIQTKISKDVGDDAQNVVVVTNQGKVTLSGTVEDEETKTDIETIAKDVAGVNNVVNNLIVQEQADS